MNLEKAILATISYHDIFRYPLMQEEVSAFLIENNSGPNRIKLMLKKLINQKKIEKTQNYFHLKRKSKIVNLRLKRTHYSQNKFKKAIFYSRLLKLVPTISSVCLTGALSMANSSKNDDIDLLIITNRRTLWTSRFFANAILLPFKRSPTSKHNSNKACLNIFLDEEDLKISEENIYTAHEICQTKLLWGRSSYLKFLRTNSWYKKYLPNWTPSVEILKINDERQDSITLVLSRIALVAEPLEALAKWGQLSYMRPKITIERIGDTQLFFHPKTTQNEILKKYYKKISQLS